MSFVAIFFQTGICITCVHSMWLFTFLTKLAVSTAIKFAYCITNHLKCFRINHQRQEWHNQIMELSAVRCYYFKGLHYTTDWQRILIQQTFHILGLTLYGFQGLLLVLPGIYKHCLHGQIFCLSRSLFCVSWWLYWLHTCLISSWTDSL